jgi:hypothetical protein
MLRFYRWCYWKIYWWRGHGEIAVSGEGPEIDELRKLVEEREQRRQDFLRRWKLI